MYTTHLKIARPPLRCGSSGMLSVEKMFATSTFAGDIVDGAAGEGVGCGHTANVSSRLHKHELSHLQGAWTDPTLYRCGVGGHEIKRGGEITEKSRGRGQT